jgi:polysaccharide export outer membrane protein
MFKTNSAYDYAEFKPEQVEYIIQPYDDLDIKIYTNKGDRLIDVKGDSRMQQNPIVYTVEYDGQVKIPTLGLVKISGKTVREAEKMLEQKYQAFFKEPFVKLEVTNKRVIVFSSGSSAGQVIQFSNDNYTLIEALAQSGGIEDYGKSYKIKLLRGDLNNPQIFIFNIRNIKDINNVNFQVLSNDIIYVEDRPRYATKFLKEITPYLTLFTSIFTVYLLVSNL